MSENFLGATPILPVKSVKDTARFFEEELGFTAIIEWENPSYGVVKRGETVIEFGEGRSQHAGSGVLNIHVENADAIFNEWQSKGVEFVGDLADRDYGCRDFRIRDNNGNMLIVSHSLDNQDELIGQGNLRAAV